MRSPLRFSIPVSLGLFLMVLPLSASAVALVPSPAGLSIDELVSQPSALAELEIKAAQAEPRERCYLYTELLHQWTEVAGRSLAEGDMPSAALAIQHADTNAARLKEAINHDSKRLKNAEQLMEHSVHRLSDMLRVSTLEQHDAFQAVLRHVSNVHDDLLAAVFQH